MLSYFLHRKFNSVNNNMNNSYDNSAGILNLTDRVGSLPIPNMKGTMRKGSKD